MRVRRHPANYDDSRGTRARRGHQPPFLSFFLPLNLSLSLLSLKHTQARAPTSTLSRYRSMSHNTQTLHHRLAPKPKTTPLRYSTHNTTDCACCCHPITSSASRCHGDVHRQTRPAALVAVSWLPRRLNHAHKPQPRNVSTKHCGFYVHRYDSVVVIVMIL